MSGRTGPTAAALAALLFAVGGAGGAAAQDRSPAGPDELGRRVYAESCARCHGADGRGIAGVYPALAGDPFVTAAEEPAVRVVLAGRAPAPDVPQMPRFDDLLSDEEIAAVVSYVRSAWGNDAGPVGAGRVAALRERVSQETPAGERVELPSGWRAEGERLVEANCLACHQQRGRGAEGIIPALAGNPVVTSAPEPLVHTVLNGRGGMPMFGPVLSDEELAYVLSYIRTSWGNDASPISPAMVSALPRPVEDH